MAIKAPGKTPEAFIFMYGQAAGDGMLKRSIFFLKAPWYRQEEAVRGWNKTKLGQWSCQAVNNPSTRNRRCTYVALDEV